MLPSSLSDLPARLLMLVPVWLSLTVHEFAHAWSAFKLGDGTAQEQGRLTLNPLAHIDFIGTLILPLLGIPFGWAKPVPVNPLRFDRRWNIRHGMLLTAAAGPISNLLLALLSTIVLGVMARVGVIQTGAESYYVLLRMLIVINISLAVFNMLPLYPLDGSRVADGVMPDSMRPAWEKFCRVAPFLFLGVIIFGREIIAIPSEFLLTGLNGLLRLIING